jgi:hypothetical protein
MVELSKLETELGPWMSRPTTWLEPSPGISEKAVVEIELALESARREASRAIDNFAKNSSLSSDTGDLRNPSASGLVEPKLRPTVLLPCRFTC